MELTLDRLKKLPKELRIEMLLEDVCNDMNYHLAKCPCCNREKQNNLDGWGSDKIYHADTCSLRLLMQELDIEV